MTAQHRAEALLAGVGAGARGSWGRYLFPCSPEIFQHFPLLARASWSTVLNTEKNCMSSPLKQNREKNCRENLIFSSLNGNDNINLHFCLEIYESK